MGDPHSQDAKSPNRENNGEARKVKKEWRSLKSKRNSTFFEKLMFFETGQRVQGDAKRNLSLPARLFSSRLSAMQNCSQENNEKDKEVLNRLGRSNVDRTNNPTLSASQMNSFCGQSSCPSEIEGAAKDKKPIGLIRQGKNTADLYVSEMSGPEKSSPTALNRPNQICSGLSLRNEHIEHTNRDSATISHVELISGVRPFHEDEISTPVEPAKSSFDPLAATEDSSTSKEGQKKHSNSLSIIDYRILRGKNSKNDPLDTSGSNTYQSISEPVSNINEDSIACSFNFSQSHSAPNLLSCIPADEPRSNSKSIKPLKDQNKTTFIKGTVGLHSDSSPTMDNKMSHCTSNVNKATADLSPHSHSCVLETDKALLIQSEKKTSTANISLTQNPMTSVKYFGNEERKIHVIKSADVFQCRANCLVKKRSSPRLDEWLRSVVKVQNEMASQKTTCWPFPEDDCVANLDNQSVNDQTLTSSINPTIETSETFLESRRLSSPLPSTASPYYDADNTLLKRPRSYPLSNLSIQKCHEEADLQYLLSTHKLNTASNLHGSLPKFPLISNSNHVDEMQTQEHFQTNELSCDHSLLTIQEKEEQQHDTLAYVKNHSIDNRQERFSKIGAGDLSLHQKPWSSTGVNTDITLPVTSKTAFTLCAFCKSCRSDSGDLGCASTRLHGICCACRVTVDQNLPPFEQSTCCSPESPRLTPYSKKDQSKVQASVQTEPNHEFPCTSMGKDKTVLTQNQARSISRLYNPVKINKCTFESDGTGFITGNTCRPRHSPNAVTLSPPPPHPTIGITIQVAEEEDKDFERHMTQAPSAFRAVGVGCPGKFENYPVTGRSMEQSRSRNGNQPMNVRGTSPHYMFPSSANPCDDEFLLRQPMSPRNSIGSISSIHSYKSSNADSAVDLCPPDEDHDNDQSHDQDFEFDEFLMNHQSRQSFIDHQNTASGFSSLGALVFPSFCANQERSLSPPAHIPAFSPKTPAMTPLSSSSTPVPCEDSFHQQHSQSCTDRVLYVTDKKSISSAQNETNLIKNKTSNKSLHSTFDGDTMYKSSLCLKNQISVNKQRDMIRQSQSSSHGNISIIHNHHTQTHQVTVNPECHFKPLQHQTCVNAEHHDSISQITPQVNEPQCDESKQSLSPRPQLPELIISDHSSDNMVVTSSPADERSVPPFSFSVEDTSDTDSSIHSQRSSPNMSISSGTYTPTFGDLLQVGNHMRIRRTNSSSSVSSEGSTCSTCSYVSNYGDRPKKVSKLQV
ncbi:hypothetical protein PoB_000941000 [Plakobranchus ocellatus]|uniref:Uncharacterized protein n=1 Tax=Plakobranchus ocellatus TaxID=259542 RepID=A0AAV3YJJ6_9GAST|nr:hypothetical protein PoB_000941000 [Plakobranchus ocellatus]